MMDYLFKNKSKRIYLENQIYFVTSKTFDNQSIFQNKNNAKIFLQTFDFLKARGDFDLFVACLLPDHFHLLIRPVKKNISEIIHDLKGYTTTKISEQILLSHGVEFRRGVEASPVVEVNIHHYNYRRGFHALPSYSKRKTISIKIWQKSFYYHLILSEKDLNNHFNYIIYNPQKHEYVLQAKDWPWLWYDFNISP